MEPVNLYYGTSLEFSELIDNVGIEHKVSLTTNLSKAYYDAISMIYRPGSSCLQPVICVVNLSEMIKHGFVFEHDDCSDEYYISNIPSEYITQVAVETEDDLILLAHYAQEQVCY